MAYGYAVSTRTKGLGPHVVPNAALRYCTVNGCPEKVPYGRCQKHQKAQQHIWHQHTALYGRRWKAARLVFLAQHPYCKDCGSRAEEVDHVIPHRGDKDLFWDVKNWASRCKSCHSAKTARETGWSAPKF